LNSEGAVIGMVQRRDRDRKEEVIVTIILAVINLL